MPPLAQHTSFHKVARVECNHIFQADAGISSHTRKDLAVNFSKGDRILGRAFVFVEALLVVAIGTMLSALAGSQTSGPLATQALISKLKCRSIGPYIGGRVVTVTGVPGNLAFLEQLTKNPTLDANALLLCSLLNRPG